MLRSAARATALLAVHSGRTPTALELTATAPPTGARIVKASGHSDLVPGAKAGFPCRFGDCRIHFAVVDPSSMASLLAASEERTAHELAEHGYHHERLEESTYSGIGPFSRRPPQRGTK